MNKYLLAVLLICLFVFVSCQSIDTNTTKSSTRNIINVMVPKDISNEVLLELTKAVPYIDFIFSDSVDFSKYGYYLVIVIDGYDNSEVYEQAPPLTGPDPHHGFGGTANGIVVFTYLKFNTVEAISSDFSGLIGKGNFFPPEMMDLFEHATVTTSIEPNEPVRINNPEDTEKTMGEPTVSDSSEEKKITVTVESRPDQPIFKNYSANLKDLHIVLEWSEPFENATYQLQMSKADNFLEYNDYWDIEDNSFDLSVHGNNQYYFRVRAKIGEDYKPWSNGLAIIIYNRSVDYIEYMPGQVPYSEDVNYNEDFSQDKMNQISFIINSNKLGSEGFSSKDKIMATFRCNFLEFWSTEGDFSNLASPFYSSNHSVYNIADRVNLDSTRDVQEILKFTDGSGLVNVHRIASELDFSKRYDVVYVDMGRHKDHWVTYNGNDVELESDNDILKQRKYRTGEMSYGFTAGGGVIFVDEKYLSEPHFITGEMEGDFLKGITGHIDIAKDQDTIEQIILCNLEKILTEFRGGILFLPFSPVDLSKFDKDSKVSVNLIWDIDNAFTKQSNGIYKLTTKGIHSADGTPFNFKLLISAE